LWRARRPARVRCQCSCADRRRPPQRKLCGTVPGPIAETLAGLLLVGTLGWAMVRPWGLPEAVVAVPAAALLLLLGVLSLSQAGAEAKSLAPTIGFLAAVLVLANLCDRYGLFEAAGTWMATGSRGRPVSRSSRWCSRWRARSPPCLASTRRWCY
jgi:arsenical pump membrane protein